MKTTITRVELKEIYKIACPTWQSKIENYAKENPFSDTIEFSEKQIEGMIKASTVEQLPIVKKIFDIVDIFESIKTLEDACKQLGEIDNEVKQLRLLQNVPNLERKTLAGQELTVITKALNNKEVLDWNNSDECKYMSWWYLGDNFRLRGVGCCGSGSNVPARLYSVSREIAQYSADSFKEIWKDYINN